MRHRRFYRKIRLEKMLFWRIMLIMKLVWKISKVMKIKAKLIHRSWRLIWNLNIMPNVSMFNDIILKYIYFFIQKIDEMVTIDKNQLLIF